MTTRGLPIVVGLVALAAMGCGQTTEQRLAKEDRNARAAQARDIAALTRAERRSAAAGLELIDQARASCRHVRLESGRSTPAEAHRLAVRFARGFNATIRPGMVAACAKELGR